LSSEQKTLYLVRHAKSSWTGAYRHDRERPLNQRGHRNALDMGKRMAAQGHHPDLIISSPANRAVSTARHIAEQLAYKTSAIVENETLYLSGVESMQRVLENLDDRYEKVMMVGHNPDMTDLVNELGHKRVTHMPTCAVAVIDFGIATWADLSSSRGELRGYDFPKGPGNFTQYLTA